MKAMVLCAGLGTRLRPLTERWPKPALPLLGQPLLRYALAILKWGGVTELAINTHHLPSVMEETAKAESQRAGLPLFVSHEPVIQGTAGGIRGARSFLRGERFVVWNGDILFALDLAAVLAEHATSGAAATMVLMPMPPGEAYAAVDVDEGGRVVRIAGRGAAPAGTAPWHFTGVHVLEPSVFDFMSAEGEEDINRAVYPRMMAQGLAVHGAVVRQPWSDLGTPARYLGTQAALLRGEVPMAPFAGASPFDGATARGTAWLRGGELEAAVNGPAYVDRGATVDAGASIGEGVYVGPGSRVGAGARVERSALLEGARVEAGETVLDTIAWSDRRLRVS